MYDAFSALPTNIEPYTVTQPTYDLLEQNPRSGPYARSAPVEMEETDPTPTPQHVLDKMLWHSVHGSDSPAPAPGPNGVPGG
jgi:hypothetical protein